MRISDWSSDVCSSDLCAAALVREEIHPMVGVAIEGAQVQIAPVESALPVAVQIPGLIGSHVHILVRKALIGRVLIAALQLEQADIGLRGETQRMVRFLIFGRTDDAVMVAAFVIVGLGEGTGIAEAEPVACRRDRKRATETVTIAAIEGRELTRQ